MITSSLFIEFFNLISLELNTGVGIPFVYHSNPTYMSLVSPAKQQNFERSSQTVCFVYFFIFLLFSLSIPLISVEVVGRNMEKSPSNPLSEFEFADIPEENNEVDEILGVSQQYCTKSCAFA